MINVCSLALENAHMLYMYMYCKKCVENKSKKWKIRNKKMKNKKIKNVK